MMTTTSPNNNITEQFTNINTINNNNNNNNLESLDNSSNSINNSSSNIRKSITKRNSLIGSENFDISPSSIPFSSNHHQHNTNYPNINQFKASGHILSKSQNNIHTIGSGPNPSTSLQTNSDHHIPQPTQTHQHHQHHHRQHSLQPYQQRVVDPDEEPINVKTFSGIFYSILIFIISFLPLFFIENLLTLFAWVQLELLKAKGRGLSPEQSYSKLKKKRKLLKKKKPQIILHKSPLNHKHHHKLSTSTSSTSISKNKSKITSLNSNNNNIGSNHNDNIKSNIDTQINNSILTSSTPTIKLTTVADNAIHKDDSILLTLQNQHLLHHHHDEGFSNEEEKPIYQLIDNDISSIGSTISANASSNGNEQQQLSNSHELLKFATNNSLRQRSDSVTVLPSMESVNLLIPKPISEIRRVNSEATLYNTNEDNLLLEANQQSKKEFEDFLRSVKDIKDVHNWLKNFSTTATKKIAIVKISRRILDTPFGVESAASSLCFMYKFGLYPIVIHGGLNDISKLPISQVIKERRMRSSLLKEAIKKNGVGSTLLTPDICEIEPYVMTHGSSGNDSDSICSSNSSGSLSEDEYNNDDILPSGGLTMKIDSFDYDVIIKALDKGKIPIWDSVAETVDGIDIPINSDITTFELAKRIQPYKIIFACNDGGILDSDHKAIPVVYLDQDYQPLVESEHITDRRRVQLKQMKRIVDHLPSSTTVVVTSIETITHQLLFPRLANGTIVKKSEDNKVIIYDSSNFSSLDQERLRVLIEDSFGRPLSTDYFDYLKETLHKLYLCVNSIGEYNGCAIVTFKHPDYIPYLCKFCVRKSAQGLGLGDLIWRILQRDNDKLYWRSRNNNPLNPWYFQRCQGSFRADESFTIFWYGDDKFEDGSHMIEAALNKPITVLPISQVK